MNDVIKFETTEVGPVMHRVIQVAPQIVTKGDANPVADSYEIKNGDEISEVIWHSNAVAPIVTGLFGDFEKITALRLITGFMLLFVSVTLIWFLIIKGFQIIFMKHIQRGVKRHDTRITE